MNEKLTIRVTPDISLTLESADRKELVKALAFYTELPKACPKCGADLVFSYRTPKDYEYFGMKCLGSPRHEVNFGEYKDSAKGLYYKDEWQNAYTGHADDYQGDQTHSGPPPAQQAAAAPTVDPATQPIGPNQITAIVNTCKELGLSPDVEASALFNMQIGVSMLSNASAAQMIVHLNGVKAGKAQALTAQPVGADGTASGSPPPPVTPSVVAAPAPVAQPTVAPTPVVAAQPVAAPVASAPDDDDIPF